MDHTTKHVLVAIGLHGNRARIAWPGQQLIANETGLTVGTVCRAVKKAQELGLLTIYKKTFQIGSHRVSNVYQLVAPHASHPDYRLARDAKTTCASRSDDLLYAQVEQKKGTKKKNKRESNDSLVSDPPFDLFWSLYPQANKWAGIRKPAHRFFQQQVRSLGGDEAAAEVLIRRVTQYAEDYKGSTLSPHNPINWLKAEGLLPAPNDHRGKAKPVDLERMAAGITVRPSKATLEHRERTK